MESCRRREMIEDTEQVRSPLECLFDGDHQGFSLGCTALALRPDNGANGVISRGGEPELLGVASNATPDLGHRETLVVVGPGAPEEELVKTWGEAHPSEFRGGAVTRLCRLDRGFVPCTAGPRAHTRRASIPERGP